MLSNGYQLLSNGRIKKTSVRNLLKKNNFFKMTIRLVFYMAI